MIKYILRDPKTKKIVARGSAPECAEQLGYASAKTFRGLVSNIRDGRSSKFILESIGEDVNAEYLETKPKREMAENWDNFCRPIRQKYGIKVKRQ